MTLDEVMEASKRMDDCYHVWMGDRIDSFESRDEAFFRLGDYLRRGTDAYGLRSSAGRVLHDGRDIGGGRCEDGCLVHFEAQ